jgi:hypothetical protein
LNNKSRHAPISISGGFANRLFIHAAMILRKREIISSHPFSLELSRICGEKYRKTLILLAF